MYIPRIALISTAIEIGDDGPILSGCFEVWMGVISWKRMVLQMATDSQN
jgi:hypothetical protein